MNVIRFATAITLLTIYGFAHANTEEIDYIKEMIVMMGTTQTMEAEIKNTVYSLKARDPKNFAYYQCLEDKLSSDAIIDKLRPYYKQIFSEQDLQNWYELLRTETGKKVIQLVKAGPPFENARTTLTQEEIREIETVSKATEGLDSDSR